VKRADVIVGLVAAGFVLGLKAAFMGAPAEAYRWLLAPTVAATQVVTQLPFSWEQGVGYVNAPLRYIIVPGCAGLTFFVAASGAAMCLLGFNRASWRARVRGMVLGVGVAFVVTLGANTVRLVTALTLLRHQLSVPGLGAEDAHRLLGVVVYLVALVLLVEALRGSGSWRWAFGLGAGWYVAVTVVVPVLRGQASAGEFVTHTVTVFAVLGGLAAALKFFRHRTSPRVQPEPVEGANCGA
jgi:exosortase K